MSPCDEVWTTTAGEEWELHNMRGTHLENTIAWLKRQRGWVSHHDVNEWVELMEQELERRQSLREQHGAGVAPF